MGESAKCRRCGVGLTGQTVDELCAHCLLKLALEPAGGDFPPLSLSSELAAPIGAAGSATEGDRVRYFGDYELVEEIARGGMGVVYKARQVSLNRTVALKMILAGDFSSPAMVERFQTEAEAAARLEHPNIVPVFEIGTHEGQHYFSMRFLEGGTLTQAIRREQFTPRQAGELMVKVSRAVHHAHQRGIIHRDLKPGNILLDVEGEPHVADFGLAKLLEHDSALTQSDAVLGTPAYMAPEQAQGQMKQATTAVDIYSLGSILYELLTGRPPFTGASPLDVLMQVREREPASPQSRQPELDRDVAVICLKCLEKDPARRYGSAEALAEELERWLAHEPIQARRATLPERVWKWAQRKPVVSGLAVALHLVAIVGIIGIVWQGVRATRAEALAQQRVIEVAAERDAKENSRIEAEAVSNFLIEVFQSPDPVNDGHTITVADVLARAVAKLDSDLQSQPARQHQLRRTLGRTYIGLGLYREAIPLLEKVREQNSATHGAEHPDTLEAITILSGCYSYVGRREEALKLREQVLDLRRKVLGPEHPDTVSSMFNLSLSYDDTGRRDEQFKLREEALAITRRLGGASRTNSLIYKRFLADHLNSLQADETLHAREDALARSRAQNDKENPATFWAMSELASELSRTGQKDKALKLREDALALSRRLYAPDHPDTLYAMNKLAHSYFETGRSDDALDLRERTLPVALKVLGEKHKYTLWAMVDLAKSYGSARRWDEAHKLLQDALEVRRKSDGPAGGDTLGTMHLLAAAYEEAGRVPESLKVREEVVSIRRKVSGEENPHTIAATTYLANGYRKAGRGAEAIQLQEPALQIIRRVLPTNHVLLINALTGLALSYESTGRKADAQPLREELVRISNGKRQRPAAAIPEPGKTAEINKANVLTEPIPR